jgi:type I restriction enzyme S subunit
MSSQELATNNNQLPEGYKKTEVGVIPEDWECEHLRDKIVITHGFGFKSQYFCSQGLYWLTTPGNFYEDGGFREIGEKQKYYNGPLPDLYLLQHGDLIVAMTEQAEGLLGSAAIIPKSGTYLHNQRLGKIKPISLDIELVFLYYIFNSKKFRLKVRETAAGTKVKHTSPTKLLEIAIPLPPLPEQKAIAQTLSDVDALIAALDKLIAKKRNIKTATMQQLLTGKTRLPGFGEGKGYKKSALGLIPEDWEVKKLGDVIKSFQNGYAFSAQNYVDYGIPIITMAQIGLDGAFQFMEECVNHWPFIYSNKLQSYQVKNGDVIISMTDVTPEKNLIGRMTIVDLEPDKTALLNQRVGLLRLDFKKVNPIFITTFSHQRKWRQYCLSVASLGVQANIGTKEITDGILVLPPLPEQQTIAQVLSDIDTEITALEKRRAKTQAIKQGMMQELLIGRTRLI